MTTLKQRRKSARLKEKRGYESVYKALNKHYTKKEIKALLNTSKGGSYNRRERRFNQTLTQDVRDPIRTTQKPTKAEKTFYRAQFNRAAKKAQTSTSNKRFIKLEKENRYLTKWEKGRKLVEKYPNLTRGSRKVNKALIGQLIVEKFGDKIPNMKLSGSKLQHENYEKYKKTLAIRALIKVDPELLEGINKYSTKPTRKQLLAMTPKEFKKFTAFKAKLSKILIKSGMIDINRRFAALGSASQWQDIIDELEEHLRES